MGQTTEPDDSDAHYCPVDGRDGGPPHDEEFERASVIRQVCGEDNGDTVLQATVDAAKSRVRGLYAH